MMMGMWPRSVGRVRCPRCQGIAQGFGLSFGRSRQRSRGYHIPIDALVRGPRSDFISIADFAVLGVDLCRSESFNQVPLGYSRRGVVWRNVAVWRVYAIVLGGVLDLAEEVERWYFGIGRLHMRGRWIGGLARGFARSQHGHDTNPLVNVKLLLVIVLFLFPNMLMCWILRSLAVATGGLLLFRSVGLT